jgi:hypothetical protein
VFSSLYAAIAAPLVAGAELAEGMYAAFFALAPPPTLILFATFAAPSRDLCSVFTYLITFLVLPPSSTLTPIFTEFIAIFSPQVGNLRREA